MTESGLPRGQGTRLARVLLLPYCLFVVYGSLFPFRFTSDPAVIQAHVARIVVRPFDARTGRRLVSMPDVASNVLLGLPAGALLVAGRLVGRSVTGRLVSVVLLDLLFAAAVEAGQLFTPGRRASLIDVEAQVVGAILGAVSGQLLLGARARAARPLRAGARADRTRVLRKAPGHNG